MKLTLEHAGTDAFDVGDIIIIRQDERRLWPAHVALSALSRLLTPFGLHVPVLRVVCRTSRITAVDRATATITHEPAT